MRYEILQPGAFAYLKVVLEAGESIKAESDAMMMMSAGIQMDGKMEGGLLSGLARSILGGESLFLAKLTAGKEKGEVMLAPALLGDIEACELKGRMMNIASGSFLAAEESVKIETKMQNLGKGIFSGAGLFVIHAVGDGIVFLNSFGAICCRELVRGEELVVDTGHLVAWEDSMQYKIGKAGSDTISSLKSGDLLVCKFTGPGKVYIQSRNPASFNDWVRSGQMAKG